MIIHNINHNVYQKLLLSMFENDEDDDDYDDDDDDDNDISKQQK